MHPQIVYVHIVKTWMALFTAIIVRSVPSHKESVVQKGLLTNTFVLPTLLTGPYHYSLIQFRKHTANQGKINFKFSSLSSWIGCAGGARSAALVPPIFSLSGSFSHDQTAAGRKLPARAALLQLGKCLDIEPDPSGGEEEPDTDGSMWQSLLALLPASACHLLIFATANAELDHHCFL